MIVGETEYGIMHARDEEVASQAFGKSIKVRRIVAENRVAEKRGFHRFSQAQPVRVQFKDPSQFTGSLSCDISEGGIRLRLSDFVPLNAELTLSIQLTDECTVECPCRVAWVEKMRFSDDYQAGLEFVGADSSVISQKIIQKFLSSQV